MNTAVRRGALLLCAAGAALLVVRAIPTLRAEWVYGAARGFGSSPADDLPGRLDAYARAAELDPGEFVYRFRRGQILLDRARRATREGGTSVTGLLDEALAEFEAAAERAPLDPRVRAAWAEALLRRRRYDAALAQLEHAVRLGPRHPDVLARAVRLHALLWRAERDVEHLRRALAVSRAADRIGSPAPADGLARAIGSVGPRVLPDLLQATADDPETAAFLAARLERRAPDLAAALTEAAGRRRP